VPRRLFFTFIYFCSPTWINQFQFEFQHPN
jgi:hypothetical protein